MCFNGLSASKNEGKIRVHVGQKCTHFARVITVTLLSYCTQNQCSDNCLQPCSVYGNKERGSFNYFTARVCTTWCSCSASSFVSCSEKSSERWWLRGTLPAQLASSIIALLKDMAAGKLSEAWAAVTKGAVAEAILGLTKLQENLRAPVECIKTPTVRAFVWSCSVSSRDM